jgi:hemoglobin
MTKMANTPYDMLGGQPTVEAIVQRFYDLVESDPAYAELHAMHKTDLGPVRESLTGFLTGWLGGPRDWFAKGGCVMSAHRPLDIGPEVTEQWIAAMKRAVIEVPVENRDLSLKMAEALGDMAKGMINRHAPAAASA